MHFTTRHSIKGYKPKSVCTALFDEWLHNERMDSEELSGNHAGLVKFFEPFAELRTT